MTTQFSSTRWPLLPSPLGSWQNHTLPSTSSIVVSRSDIQPSRHFAIDLTIPPTADSFGDNLTVPWTPPPCIVVP
jgi:hypothetical protein